MDIHKFMAYLCNDNYLNKNIEQINGNTTYSERRWSVLQTSSEQLNDISILQEDIFEKILDAETEIEKVELQEYYEKKAAELGVLTAFKRRLRAYKKDNQDVNKYIPRKTINFELDVTDKGTFANTGYNYLTIFRNDKRFKGKLALNELSDSGEKIVKGKYEDWTDTDNSNTRIYVEKTYGIHHEKKFKDALTVAFHENPYNPVKDIIEPVKWDGVSRIRTILNKWLGVKDTAYSREVSRLIFAGGINRLYEPGCKFDDMPVLIGTKQGEGKSTFVNWLALKEDYFREIKNIEGKEGVEILHGAWICEVAELLALTKTKEVEAVKAYITCRIDTYRKPYAELPTKNRRHCFFIGTTNKSEFLTDKTGNRRFYPVTVDCVGYDLFDHEAEIKADILQCWAEALHLYREGKLPAYADRELAADIKAHQDMAVEDDYREGMIEEYLQTKQKVCIVEIWEKALKENGKPSRKDSCDISLMLSKFEGWEKDEKTSRHGDYGIQKCFTNNKMPF